MDTRNGNLLPMSEVHKLPQSEQIHFIPVYRKLRENERRRKRIEMNSLCVCGSGKKFKFCCYRKVGK